MGVFPALYAGQEKARRELIDDIKVGGLTQLVGKESGKVGSEGLYGAGSIWTPVRLALPDGSEPHIMQATAPVIASVPYSREAGSISVSADIATTVSRIADEMKNMRPIFGEQYFTPNAFSVSELRLRPFEVNLGGITIPGREVWRFTLAYYEIGDDK